MITIIRFALPNFQKIKKNCILNKKLNYCIVSFILQQLYSYNLISNFSSTISKKRSVPGKELLRKTYSTADVVQLQEKRNPLLRIPDFGGFILEAREIPRRDPLD